MTSRTASIVYWIATLFIVVTSLVAGAIDLLRAPPLFEALLELGYPPHFATVLGVWKIMGALALAAPRLPLLKEWAYAGMFFDFTGACVAQASAGTDLASCISPAVSTAALLVSWYLRPPSRRLPETTRR
jgi:DoxX-like protein